MSTYNIIAASNESTVVAEYTPESSRSDSFQSEAALEKEFIRLLTTQGYEYLTIHDENGLIVMKSEQSDTASVRYENTELLHHAFGSVGGSCRNQNPTLNFQSRLHRTSF